MSSNGSNERLDRIEKLIQESERANKEAHARHESEISESSAKFDRQMAESNARFDRQMAESSARFESEMAEHRRQMDAETRKNREQMRRWTAFCAQDARNQRKRSQKLDADIDRLVSSQLETKAMLNEFIASLKTGGNGGPKAS